MATAVKTETVTLTLTREEASFLRGYLAQASGVAGDVREALAAALAPF